MAVRQYYPPATKKDLCQFLGLVGFYLCFYQNFLTVVAPLTTLKGWGEV